MRRSKGYQDLDDNGVGPRPGPQAMPPPQEIEMASVTVVPDDTFTVTQAVNALGFGWFQVKLSLCTGLCWMADSMEMTILSILSPALHCEWNISNMCGVLLFYYGLLSAIAPNFLWLLFLRGLVGFAIGCVPQSGYGAARPAQTLADTATEEHQPAPMAHMVLLKNSVLIATGVYASAALLAAVACLLLPIETKGREMRENLKVNLDEVRNEWLNTLGPHHKKQVAEHYGIFEHLYGEGYFVPFKNLDIFYDLKEKALPVYCGNVIKPSEALNSPTVSYESDGNTMWTLVLSSLDGHLNENDKEYVHWFIANIPGNHIEKGDRLVEYLQPFPLKGTGYHRYVFVLYKQNERMIYDLPQANSKALCGFNTIASEYSLIASSKFCSEKALMASDLFSSDWSLSSSVVSFSWSPITYAQSSSNSITIGSTLSVALQNPQQGNWQNIQTPQQYPNIGQDFNQQTNFNQYPSQNGYGVWNGQNQNPMIQQGNWQNGQTPQQLPNVGQDFSQQVNNYSQYPSQNGYGGDFDGQNQNPMLQQGNWQNVQTPQQAQNFNQQYPSPTQGNFNSGNSQLAGQNQNAQAQQGDWRNVRAPQKFPSQQDFSQQYNSDQYPSQSQSNFGLGANQNLNTGTIDDIKSQNEFQNQILQDNGGNTVAILGNPVPVSSTSAPDRIVFQDEWFRYS
ncbi:hypothetical protein MSG28_006135 [Choristoneura fumiferana]|uniref:Uncharacterized protein n=1 Tax=Choristoneura fumiferana TaxID=7141 RepID=A0ACC0JDT0_CHOFU|nr:hypothetical protein MSG28_006135 [Choristoneura fumiferana]